MDEKKGISKGGGINDPRRNFSNDRLFDILKAGEFFVEARDLYVRLVDEDISAGRTWLLDSRDRFPGLQQTSACFRSGNRLCSLS